MSWKAQFKTDEVKATVKATGQISRAEGLASDKWGHSDNRPSLLHMEKRSNFWHLRLPLGAVYFLDISSSYAKILGKQIFSLVSFPEVGQKQKTEKKKERESDWKLVITMASYALQTQSCLVQKKESKKSESW